MQQGIIVRSHTETIQLSSKLSLFTYTIFWSFETYSRSKVTTWIEKNFWILPDQKKFFQVIKKNHSGYKYYLYSNKLLDNSFRFHFQFKSVDKYRTTLFTFRKISVTKLKSVKSLTLIFFNSWLTRTVTSFFIFWVIQ